MARSAGVGLFLLLLLGASLIITTGLGEVYLSPHQVWGALRHGPQGADTGDWIDRIVWGARLPRVIMACLIGASLSAAGAAFQSLLRNDLADPYLVGVSAGASVGTEAVLLRGAEGALRGLAVPLAAFLSAAGAVTFVYALARRGGRVLVTSLLLGGVVVSAFLGGVSTVLLILSRPNDTHYILYRLSGWLEGATFGQCGVVLAFLAVGLLVLLREARSMDLFALGEESAQQLGVETERFKTTLILTGSLLTAATVAFAGIIGFVGLMVPHIARCLAGTPAHRRVLPLAVVAGAVLMVWADTLARAGLTWLHRILPAAPDSVQMPVGIIMAFLGAPFFCYLLRRQSRVP